MATKKALDLKAQKEKKQKKIAAIGGVFLLLVMGIQVPRTMKMLSPPAAAEASAPPAATAPTTTTGPVSLEPPTLAGGAGAPAAPPEGGVSDSDPVPAASAGQLVSFSRFASKDPFAQQVGGATAPAAPAAGDEAADSAPGVKPGAKPGGSEPSTDEPAKPAAQKPTSAVLSVNGVEETVAVGGDFPVAGPVFRLVKLGAKSASLAIAGGSYADGQQTVTLRLGRTLTLMNTADGTRYEVKLVSVGVAPVASVPASVGG